MQYDVPWSLFSDMLLDLRGTPYRTSQKDLIKAGLQILPISFPKKVDNEINKKFAKTQF